MATEENGWCDPADAPDDAMELAVVLRFRCGPYEGGRFISTAGRIGGHWILPPHVEDIGHVDIVLFTKLPTLPPFPETIQ
ncbi:MAG: hypothetical protein KGJ57_17635 [Sphingomonadales bacterium]|nr:hypothetical protein [Sphingomonadales bacterium]MDE2171221.1 hypothetical protein [Sphingomonadales bacterium]